MELLSVWKWKALQGSMENKGDNSDLGANKSLQRRSFQRFSKHPHPLLLRKTCKSFKLFLEAMGTHCTFPSTENMKVLIKKYSSCESRIQYSRYEAWSAWRKVMTSRIKLKLEDRTNHPVLMTADIVAGGIKDNFKNSSPDDWENSDILYQSGHNIS